MIRTFSLWWAERSGREQWLLGVMGALIAAILCWLLIVRPVEAGLADAKLEHQAAIDRNATVRQRLAQLAALPPRQSAAQAAPVEQIITDSGTEAGFAVTQRPGAAAGVASVSIATARPTALLGWLSRLEGQGLLIESLTVQPADAGAVSAQVDIRRVAP